MSPREVLWRGEATSITAENSEGLFDILPDHARFLTVISGRKIVVVGSDGVDHSFTFASAVLSFADNEAKIYTHEPVNVASQV
ncbi:F0F1 ATP synthase subunit epsilon [Patescibacteria group bacterium]|nr:F0F1 ATP synthase subunit epsilon [Patescibacteria group bacterium]